MSRSKIIAGLDIGSNSISVVVGQKTKNSTLEILGTGRSEAYGIKKGIVTDIEEASESILKAINEAEQESGFSIREVVLGLNGCFIFSTNSYGQVSISSIEDEISFEDVARAVESSKKLNLDYGTEIIHILPRTFAIDGQLGIRNPIGMSGLKLEVENHVLVGNTPTIKNIVKCLERIQIKSAINVVSVASNGYYLLPSQSKELGSIIIDIGKDLTSVAIFEEGEITYTAILPIGAGYITQDIVIGLKTSYQDAEKIKQKYGDADPSQVSEEDTFNLSEINPYEDRVISKKYLSHVINARVREIFKLVIESLKKSPQKEFVLPAGAVITGGGANLKNIEVAGRKVLNLPCLKASHKNLSGLTESVKDLKYSSCLSLLNWYFESVTDFANSENSDSPRIRLGGKRKSNGMVKWIKSFLP